MASEKNEKVCPQVVKLDRALKIAEEWVDKMSASTSDENVDKEFEGRPPRLGLGAKLNRHTEVADFTDPVKRKILNKLGIGNKKPSIDQDNLKQLKSESPSDESDDESESRANAFAKKRTTALPSATPMKKKQKF